MLYNVIGWYAQGALTGNLLQEAIDEAANGLAADKNELAQLQVTPAELEAAHFTVRQEAGFIAEGILLAIAIGAGGNLTADAAKTLWEAVLKRVRDDRGDDAIGPEKQPERGEEEK